MKLSVLALDYDGTITKGDSLEPSVLLVTGRILEELERVTGALHFVDGVIAENGAVMYFPDSGYLTARHAGDAGGRTCSRRLRHPDQAVRRR